MTNLRIGKVPGVTLTKWQRIWSERFPGVPLLVSELEESDQRRALLDGEVDMCFARLPLERDGLHAIALYDELPVVWMAKDHVLAELNEVATADLADEVVLHAADRASLELATYSAAVLRVPMSVARNGSRRDMVYRVVTDADPATIALTWRVDDDSALIQEFIGVVRGRTVNSSRTAAQRSQRGQAAATKGSRSPRSADSGRRTGKRRA